MLVEEKETQTGHKFRKKIAKKQQEGKLYSFILLQKLLVCQVLDLATIKTKPTNN